MQGPKRTSLLDHVSQKLVEQRRVVGLSRVVYVGTFAESFTNRKELASVYQRYWVQTEAMEDVSGLLLVLGNYALHCIEAPDSVLLPFLRELGKSSIGSESVLPSFLTGIKILVSTEDIPRRAFGSWFKRIVSGTRVSGQYDIDDERSHESDVISDAYRKLIKMGPKMNPDAEEDHFPSPELVPSLDRLQRFAEASTFPSLHDWLDVYDSHVPVSVLEEDLVWPAVAPPKFSSHAASLAADGEKKLGAANA